MEERRKRGDLLETHKIMHGLERIPEVTFFARGDILRRGHTLKIYKERSKREPRRNFFSQRVVIPWKALPEKVSESESEMFLFDPYQKYIQSNNETILDQGTPTKTSLVANIRAAYYIINNYFFISQAKNT